MKHRTLSAAAVDALIDHIDCAHLPWFAGNHRCSDDYEALLQHHTERHGARHPKTMETLTYAQLADGFEGLDEDGRLAHLKEAESVLRTDKSGDPYVLALNLAGQGLANYIGVGDFSSAVPNLEEALQLLSTSPRANFPDVWFVAEYLAACLSEDGQPLSGLRVLDDYRPRAAGSHVGLECALRHLEVRADILSALHDSADQTSIEAYRATGAPGAERDTCLAAILALLAAVALESIRSRSRLHSPSEQHAAREIGRSTVDRIIELAYGNRNLRGLDLACIKTLLGRVAL